MSLQNEIDRKAKAIHTSGYPMSIGELISLYRDYELDLHPEFQRFFRWDDYQKSRFIESILIGIPIPSIFVYQRDDGIWDVIDGVQRLSTIFQFIGILEGENGRKPFRLKATKYLPSLEGKIWQNENQDDNCFTMAQRIEFKRTQFDIKIIKEDENQDARYELFKRINLGGSNLSKQEVRNLLLVMINRKVYEFIEKMALKDYFQSCLQIPDNEFSTQYDLELVSRFFVLKKSHLDEIQKTESLSAFITDKMIEFAKTSNFNEDGREEQVFKKVFKRLFGIFKGKSFKKFDAENNFFSDDFSIAAFETISVGLAANIDKWEEDKDDDLKSKIISLWTNPVFKTWKDEKDGKKRIINLIPFAREFFYHENSDN